MQSKTVHKKRSPRAGRRALALLLSCLMAFTLLPTAALAEGAAYTVIVSVKEEGPYCKGDEIFLLADVKDADGTAVTTGKVQFYMGETALDGPVNYNATSGFGKQKGFSLAVLCAETSSFIPRLAEGDNSITAAYTSASGEVVTSEPFTVSVSSKRDGGEYISCTTYAGTLASDGVTPVSPVQFGVANQGGDKGIIASDFVITGTKDGDLLDASAFTVEVNDGGDVAKVFVNAPGTYVFTASFGEGSDFTGGKVSDPVTIAAKSTDLTPTVDGSSIHANGAALILAAGTNDSAKTAVYIDVNRDGQIDADDVIFDPLGESGSGTAEGNDLSAYVIYGGGQTALAGNTQITMLGGKVLQIFGGGNKAPLTGDTQITMLGGQVTEIYGGGYYPGGTVTGSSQITVNGGHALGVCGGGSYQSALTGSTLVTIGQDAKADFIYGGGNSGSTVGTADAGTTVTVRVAGKTTNVYGGGKSDGTVCGDVSVSVTETGTVTGSVYGGDSSGGTVNGNTAVTITGTVTGSVYGGGKGGDVTGTKTVTVGGGAKVGGEDKGIVINGGAATPVTNGVDRVVIQKDNHLTSGADVNLLLPEGWASGVIAAGAAAEDARYVHLKGAGAADKTVSFHSADSTLYAGGPCAEVLGSDGQRKAAYAGLAEAFAAAESGETVRLLEPAWPENAVSFDSKALTLELNGKSIQGTSGGSTIEMKGTAVLTIRDSSAGKTGGITAGFQGTAVRVYDSGALTVLGGHLLATGNQTIGLSETAALTVSGGTVTALDDGRGLHHAIFSSGTGKITIGGDAVITGDNANAEKGTVRFYSPLTAAAAPVLEIKDAARVINTSATGNAVCFSANTGVTKETVSSYYTAAESATVGRVFPAPYAAEYTADGGRTWTKCRTVWDALKQMTVADDAATYQVRLLEDNATSSTWGASSAFTLDLNGFTCARWNMKGSCRLTVTDSAGGGQIIGQDAAENAAPTPAVSVTEQAVLTLASTGGKAFTLQGGKGLASDTADIRNGAPGVQVGRGAALTVLDRANAVSVLGGSGATHTNGGWGGNAVAADGGALQLTGGVFTGGSGGNGTATGTGIATGGQGGHGLYSSDGTLSATGGVFTGGRGGSSASDRVGASGGDGISLNSGGGAAVLTGLTCTGGAGGTGMMGGTQGEGLSADSVDVTINGGAFTGRDGCSLMNGIDDTKDCRWVVTGGSFTGSSCGLYTQKMGADPSLSVTGGVFSGGNAALYANLAGALSGGAFTGTGADAYAVSYGYTSGTAASLLASGMVYFGTDGQPVTEGLDSAALGQNTILRVAPAGSTPEPLYSISGTVSDAHAADLKGAVQLVQRGRVLQTVPLENNPCPFTFSGVAPGIYTLAATNTVGGYNGSTYMTDTRQVAVSGGDVTGVAMGWSAGHYVSSEVEVKGDMTPPVSAGGLEQIAASVDNHSDVCTVRLTVEAVAAPADKAEIDALAAGKTMDLYLDLGLVLLKNGSVSENLTDAKGKVLEITVPYDFTNKQNVTVYRKHGSEAAVALTEDTGGGEGTFTLDKANGCIHIYAGKFSTYAVGYTATTTPPSGGSGGSGGTRSYTITATAGEGGTISPSGKVSVTRGSDKTFAIKPDNGYTVADVLVDGKSVGAVERYTFEKVAKAHTIAASFQKESDKAAWNPFADVRADDWFYESVQYVYEHDLMLGTSDTTFSPAASTERGMIVTILWRMEGRPEAADAQNFSDVQSGAYCAEAVAWANENGIVLGYGNGRFGPKDTITREQLAAILYRYARYKGADMGAGGTLDRFTDAAEISDYAREAMAWAVEQGIITGKSGGVLAPKGQATRGETAAMLMRYLQD